MEKELKADFQWWVEETGNLDAPKTGDASNVTLWICLLSGSLMFLAILLKKRRKGKCSYAE